MVHSLDQVKWTYITPFHRSTLAFKVAGGEIFCVTFSSPEVLLSGNDRFKVDDLQSYLTSKMYEDVYASSGDTTLGRVIYFAPTPFREEEYLVCEPLASNEPVVLLDTRAFMRKWRKQSMPGYRVANSIRRRLNFREISGNSDDLELVNSTRSLSKHWSLMREMPYGVGFNYLGNIAFTNGRHRTVNLANAGSPYIPAQVAVEQEHEMRNHFEWQEINRP